LCNVIDAQNIIRGTRRSKYVSLLKVDVAWCAECLFDLPHEVPLVGHGADGIDWATACLELEVAVRFAALAAQMMNRILIDRAIATTGVDEIAIWTPASACAPRRCAALWDYSGNW